MSDFTGRTQYTLDGTIENNGFFPDLELSEFQREWRIANDYRQEAIELHINNAILEINRQLYEFQFEHQDRTATLELLEQPSLGSKKAFVHQYKRAVYAHAKAYLLREFATINRREQAENLARESEDSHDALLEQSSMAVRYILGYSNIGVELL